MFDKRGVAIFVVVVLRRGDCLRDSRLVPLALRFIVRRAAGLFEAPVCVGDFLPVFYYATSLFVITISSYGAMNWRLRVGD